MSDAFRPPNTESDPIGDIPVGTPWIVVVACVVLGISGVMQGMTGLQVVLFVQVYSVFWVVPWVLMAFGAAIVGCAAWLYDCRWMHGLLGWVLTVLCLFLNLAWNVFAVSRGMFSLMAWLSIPMAMIPAVIVPFAIPAARTTWRARIRLAGASWV